MATPIELQPTKPSGKRKSQKTGLRIQEYFYLCLQNWPWFVLSIVICMALAYIYIKKTTPTYQKSASILLKINDEGRTTEAGNALFSDMGVGVQNSLLKDEIQVIKSPDLMQDVVRRLNLNMSYSRKGQFRTIGLYGSNLPVEVVMPDMKDTESCSMKLKLSPNGEFTITDMVLKGRKIPHEPINGRIGTPVRTPLGSVIVKPSAAYTGDEDEELTVAHNPVKATALALNGALKVETAQDAWNLVNMTINDWSPERARDVLTQLIACYNDRWMLEKKTLADNTSKFIDERVKLLQNELGSVDNDISSFKSANLLPDIDAAASLAMSQASQSAMALKDLRNQEYMAKYIRNYLRNSENNNKLLPANTGMSSAAVGSQIAEYNTRIMERNSLVAQSSTSNPLVTQLDQQIQAMRGALLASIENEIVALGEQIRAQEGITGSANSRIASNPRQAKYLLSVERQQKVKETLYLYLLQKREENQLNQAFTSYNTRVVREADGSDAPIAPIKANIYLVAFLIGLGIPALWIFQREMSVHVVRGRKDVADMAIPLAGELPLHSKKQKLPKVSLSLKNQNPKPKVVVKANSRNTVNEAFRVLRTNLEFMFSKDNKTKVVMLTSANPGSGKTFVTFNLAKSFAIKGKKVVCLDLDMRRASLSKYVDSPTKGISDYLANRVGDITDIIKIDSDCENLSVIPVGTIPPNPTELLFNERLHALLEDLKMHYDYVFIDCPPVEVVADASIISREVDYTIFVVRAGLFDLDMLPLVDDMYEKGTYPGMSLVLNGTINPNGTYARRYGNPYSYGYGYGTGYSYNNED